MTGRIWDIGDPEPEGVFAVRDYTDYPDGKDPGAVWMRTYSGQWKGYKDDDKAYLEWADLVRRWGPVTEVTR